MAIGIIANTAANDGFGRVKIGSAKIVLFANVLKLIKLMPVLNWIITAVK
jgi:hypothetical protein